MRELTQTEIEKAPRWATHYWMAEGEPHIRWQNNEELKYLWSNDACPWSKRTAYSFTDSGEPIPRKEFDIHSVRLSDDNIDCLGHCDNKKLWTYFKDDTYHTSETREDVISKAKHFKLTAEDLR